MLSRFLQRYDWKIDLWRLAVAKICKRFYKITALVDLSQVVLSTRPDVHVRVLLVGSSGEAEGETSCG